MNKAIFAALFLTCFASAAEEPHTISYTIVKGRIMVPQKPAIPRECDVVTDLTVTDMNKVTLSDRFFGKCELAPIEPNTRTYSVILESQFLCGSTYTAGTWGQETYLVLNDYRFAPAQCFKVNENFPFPLVSDVSIEERRNGSNPAQYLSLECSQCEAANPWSSDRSEFDFIQDC